MTQVAGRLLGHGQHACFIVSDIGINHNGDMELARRMVEAAATCGADSVKSKNYSLRASSRTAHSCIPTYFQSYGLPIMRTRAFNHEGPRRGDVFVTSNFAKQVAEIEAGLREPIVYVGDLKPRRDYSDVRDIVRGYWTLLERGEPGEVYNLCSGRSWLIQEVLDFYLRESRVKDIAVKTDPARMRPSDVMILEGDPSKIAKLGWKVEIPFERTLADLLAYWRQRTSSSSR